MLESIDQKRSTAQITIQYCYKTGDSARLEETVTATFKKIDKRLLKGIKTEPSSEDYQLLAYDRYIEFHHKSFGKAADQHKSRNSLYMCLNKNCKCCVNDLANIAGKGVEKLYRLSSWQSHLRSDQHNKDRQIALANMVQQYVNIPGTT